MELGQTMDTLKERSARRKIRIVAHRAENFEEAELWDLEFWQALSPQDRLSALVAIRNDIEKVNRAKKSLNDME